jgi:hypothetical protein
MMKMVEEDKITIPAEETAGSTEAKAPESKERPAGRFKAAIAGWGRGRRTGTACAGAAACIVLAGCGITFALGGCGTAAHTEAGSQSWAQDGGNGDTAGGADAKQGDSVKVTTSDGKTVDGTVNADGSVTTSEGKTVAASEAGSNAVQITSGNTGGSTSDNGGASSSDSGSAPAGDSGSSGASPSAPSDPNAGKTWVADYTTVHHAAVTHVETVVDQAEQIVTRIIFSDGAVFDGASYGNNGAAQDAAGDYQEQCALKGHRVSYSSDAYTTPAVTHQETVVDSPAYDEQVANGGHWA